jgi:hypothetical protein
MVPNKNAEPETEEINPLTGAETDRTKNLVGRIRNASNQLPPDRVGEVTSLLATVEGHLAADPPNAVAAREAIAMIRDEFIAGGSPENSATAAELDRVLQMLGEVE